MSKRGIEDQEAGIIAKKTKNNEESKECSICFEMVFISNIITTPCLHTFCQDCYDKWIVKFEQKLPTCPMCRASMSFYHVVDNTQEGGMAKIPIEIQQPPIIKYNYNEEEEFREEEEEEEEEEDDQDDVDEQGNLRGFVVADDDDNIDDLVEEIEDENEREYERILNFFASEQPVEHLIDFVVGYNQSLKKPNF